MRNIDLLGKELQWFGVAVLTFLPHQNYCNSYREHCTCTVRIKEPVNLIPREHNPLKGF